MSNWTCILARVFFAMADHCQPWGVDGLAVARSLEAEGDKSAKGRGQNCCDRTLEGVNAGTTQTGKPGLGQ